MSESQGASGTEIAPGIRVGRDALRIEYVRSSGPGGQHVNTRATKAILRIRLSDIPVSGAVIQRLRRIASAWLTEDDEIRIASDVHRSQERNRSECLRRLRGAIVEARKTPKLRRATRPSRSAIERRLRQKRRRSEIKRGRRRPPEEG